MRNKWSSLLNKYDAAIWIRFTGTMMTAMCNFMIRPFLVLYLYDQLNGSVLLPMIVVGLQPLTAMIVNGFGGNLSDRFGRKPVMVVSLAIQALSLSGFMLASNVWEYAAMSVLGGIGSALFYPAANAQVADVVPEDRRAEVFALLHTALNLGSALGPLTGLLLFAGNPKYVFLLSAVTVLAYLLLVLRKLPETRPEHLAVNRVVVKSKAPKERKHAAKVLKEGWAAHRNLWAITLFSIPVGLLYSQVDTTLPLHLANRFEHYKSVLASLLTFNGIVVILLQMWIAKKSENVRPDAIIGISYALFAIVAFGYGHTPWVVLLFVTEFVFTIGEMLNGPHMQKMVSQIAPPERRGFYFSVFGMSWQLGRGLGPVFSGFLFERWGGTFTFTVTSLLIVAGGIAQLWLIRSLQSRKNETVEISTAARAAG